MIRKEKNSLHILTKTKFYLAVLFFLFYKEKYIINSIDIRGEVVININKEKLAIDDNVLDIYINRGIKIGFRIKRDEFFLI